jgi:AcrR family transcriptional regulator
MTRSSILAVAREEFSRNGFGVTTNRNIATSAGITSGALYHYFESKLDLYLAVYQEVQREIVDVLKEAAVPGGTFAQIFERILDATLEMNRRDPSVGRFNSSVGVEARRHPDLALALRRRRDPVIDFFDRLIKAAAANGEVDIRDIPFVEAFVRTILLGITAGLTDDMAFQKNANEAIKRLMQSRLL